MLLARFVLLVGMVLCLARTAAAADSKSELIERIREGHRASREAIKTLHVKYDYQPLDATGTNHSRGEYWQQDDKSHLHGIPLPGFAPRQKADAEESVNGEVDMYSSADRFVRFKTAADGAEQVAPGEPKDGRPSVVLYEAPGSDNPFYDRSPWTRAGIYLSDAPIITLDELLADEDHVKSIESADWDGHRVYRVEIEREHTIISRGTFYVDPALNYLVRKVEIGCDYPDHTTPYSSHYHVEAKDFVEATPGIFFPGTTINKWFLTYPDGRPNDGVMLNQTDFTLVEINQPIDPKLLEFSIPPNSRVFDHGTKIKYVVDENSEMIGEPESINEAVDINKWMFEWPFRTFVISVLLVLGGWYLYRMRRQRASD